MDDAQAADGVAPADEGNVQDGPERSAWRNRVPVVVAVVAALVAGGALGWLISSVPGESASVGGASAPVPTSTTSSRVFSESELRAAYDIGYDRGFEDGRAEGEAEAEANAPHEPDPCLTNPRARDNGPGAPCFWWLSVKRNPTPTPTR
ncbi:hypothetical protein ADK67_46440 [Saccharothrix sp. NRRL B-16348]|nr:hypothetical protein ADK67_46440 [Saccharothrix sp. NRRL B-16348]